MKLTMVLRILISIFLIAFSIVVANAQQITKDGSMNLKKSYTRLTKLAVS